MIPYIISDLVVKIAHNYVNLANTFLDH